MKVLLVGGSGHVGTMITPYLLERHEIRVLDIRPPAALGRVEFIEGSASDPAVLRHALAGVDTFVNLLMKSPGGSMATEQTLTEILENYETNTLALHLLLHAAQELGVRQGVHTSTMSVHHGLRKLYPAEELTPLDTPSVYGFTKAIGELICEYFARWFDMNIVALRITGPRTREQYLDERRNPPEYPGGRGPYVTDEDDLARAYLAALQAVQVGHGRFDAVWIGGDENEERYNLSKAQRLLGWKPLSQALLAQVAGEE